MLKFTQVLNNKFFILQYLCYICRNLDRMSQDYRQALLSLTQKVQLLVQQYNSVLQQRNDALSMVAELKAELLQRDAAISNLKTEIENLTIVKTAFPSREAMAESKEYLSGLIREIDQCIKDLTS